MEEDKEISKKFEIVSELFNHNNFKNNFVQALYDEWKYPHKFIDMIYTYFYDVESSNEFIDIYDAESDGDLELAWEIYCDRYDIADSCPFENLD